ncbi:YeaC family protein [Vibrio sp. WXL210]|uniref:YeaC family protein n=1 Tax=Vibrio sp. WXL210 TaxID=3450709 RepID=UPI003EC89B60
MDVNQLLEAITPQVYQRLTYAIETGRWPEGQPLTTEQRDQCMQAVMLYQSKHNLDAQHMTIAAGGELHLKSKVELKHQFTRTEQEIARFEISSADKAAKD